MNSFRRKFCQILDTNKFRSDILEKFFISYKKTVKPTGSMVNVKCLQILCILFHCYSKWKNCLHISIVGFFFMYYIRITSTNVYPEILVWRTVTKFIFKVFFLIFIVTKEHRLFTNSFWDLKFVLCTESILP